MNRTDFDGQFLTCQSGRRYEIIEPPWWKIHRWLRRWISHTGSVIITPPKALCGGDSIKACIAEGKRLEALTAVQQNRLRALKERQAALDVGRATEGLL